MNSSNFTGRLIKDVEINNYQGRKGDYSIGKFTIACGTDRKKEGEKYYEDQLIPLSAFGGQADFIAKYFKKGDVIEITNAEYVSSKSEGPQGVRYFHEFKIGKNTAVGFPARSIKQNQSNESNQSGNGWPEQENEAPSQQNNSNQSDPFSGGASIDLSDDDLPF